MRLLIFTIFTYFVRARKIVFPYTSRDLGEGCRVGFFEVARKGAYLSYVTAAGVPQTKVKYAPLYKVAYLVRAWRVVHSLSFPDRARQAHTLRM